MIIHLIRPARGTNAHPAIAGRGATIPEDEPRKFSGQVGPAALPLFCLAPHGVFPASRIAPRAVSSYLAFSPLPALFSKNRRCVFCDTFRQRPSGYCLTNVARVFYAACCRMVFGLSSSKSRYRRTHQRSSAIGAQSSTRTGIWKLGSHEWDVLIFDDKVGRAVLCAPLSLGHRRARSARPTDSGL